MSAFLECQPFLCTWNMKTPKYCDQFWFRPPSAVIRNLLVSEIVDPSVPDWKLDWNLVIRSTIQGMFLRVRNVHRLQDACLQGIQVRENNMSSSFWCHLVGSSSGLQVCPPLHPLGCSTAVAEHPIPERTSGLEGRGRSLLSWVQDGTVEMELITLQAYWPSDCWGQRTCLFGGMPT